MRLACSLLKAAAWGKTVMPMTVFLHWASFLARPSLATTLLNVCSGVLIDVRITAIAQESFCAILLCSFLLTLPCLYKKCFYLIFLDATKQKY